MAISVDIVEEFILFKTTKKPSKKVMRADLFYKEKN